MHNRVHIDRNQIREAFSALEARQLDQLADHPRQPLGFGEQLLSESVHGARVVGGLQQRLSQHAHRRHRGLELMAHIGHEVAPTGFHPGLLGLIV